MYYVTAWSKKARGYHHVTFDANHSMDLLGNRKDQLRASCRAGFPADIACNPTRALADLIEAEEVGEIGGFLKLALIDSAGGFTLFPGYGASTAGGRLPAKFDASLCGGVGAFEVKLHRV